MTRKDFIIIAGIIRNMPDQAFSDRASREHVAKCFAEGLSDTNPNFKSDLFIQAATGQVALNARKPI